MYFFPLFRFVVKRPKKVYAVSKKKKKMSVEQPTKNVNIWSFLFHSVRISPFICRRQRKEQQFYQNACYHFDVDRIVYL